MRSPKTFDEFKTLIHGMTHRERFVFEIENPNDEEGAEIEIYLTIRRDGSEPKSNLFYQWRDSLGEYRQGMNKGNKLLSLVTDSYLQTIYSWIKI
jgi:hypothetical protein